MDTLPVELYRPIVQFIDRRGDLPALALTSGALRLEAERRLYREIFLSTTIHSYDLSEGSLHKRREDVHPASLGPLKTSDGQPLSLREQIDILQRLISSSRLASYVQSFSITLHPEICDQVHDALAFMLNLKRLAVQNLYSNDLYQPLSVVANGARFKLEYLNFRSRTLFEEMDALFLETHNELRELEWGRKFSIPASRPDAALDFQLPLLRTLTLRNRATLAVRPLLLHQTVTNLRMGGSSVIAAEDVYSSVQSLKLSRAFEDLHARQFPNLVYLWLRFSSDPEPIHLLTRLQKLSIPLSDGPVPTFKACHTRSMSIFATNTSLKQVEVRKSRSGFVFSRDDEPDEFAATECDIMEWRFW